MDHFSDSPTNVKNILGASEVLCTLETFLISAEPHTCWVILAHILLSVCVERWWLIDVFSQTRQVLFFPLVQLNRLGNLLPESVWAGEEHKGLDTQTWPWKVFSFWALNSNWCLLPAWARWPTVCYLGGLAPIDSWWSFDFS